MLHAMGSLKKVAPGRCISVRYSADGLLLGVLSMGKGIEVFRCGIDFLALWRFS